MLITLRMAITTRILQPADAPAYRVVRLESLRLYPGAFGSSYEVESAKPKLAFENYIEMQTPGKFIAGAFDGSTLIGICGFAADESERGKHKGTIIQVFVQPAYTGKGAGLQLLQAVVNYAFELPGIEQLLLGVITNNTAAIKLYEKVGFVTYGIHHNCFKEEDGTYLHQQFMVLGKEKDNGSVPH